jgi:hypothetical protein
MLSRRYFLAAGTGALTGLCLPAVTQAKPTTVDGIGPGIKAECEVFSEGQLVARLNQTGLSEVFKSDSKTNQYIMNFESATAAYLPEASYEVVHPQLGRLHLFLQPSGTLNVDQHDGRRYRACMTMLV